MAPRTRYARSGDLSIAYQVMGDGPVDLVVVSGYVSHLEYAWEEPGYARYLRRLASFSRLILFDKRGTGLSDRAAGIATLEERIDDARAVMDAVGSERAVLYGGSEGGPMSALFAATYPERTVALVLYGTLASFVRRPGYPWRPTAEERARTLEARAHSIHETWGNGDDLATMAPSARDDPAFRHWYGTYLRLGASPGAVLALLRMNGAIDVRHVLPTIRVPTLVLHRAGDRSQLVEEGRYVAAHIPGARFVELPGEDHLAWVGDADAIIDEIEAFVTGVRSAGEPDRVLTTILVAQIVGTTGYQGAPGDAGEAGGQGGVATLTRETVARFRGRAIALGRRHLLAVFDGPARAVRCAQALGDALRTVGLTVRAGLHTGECVVATDHLRGVAPQVADRVVALAQPGEILVSGTVTDLVAGSGLRFAPRGVRAFAGVPGEWRLFVPLRDDTGEAGAAPPAAPPDVLTRREREVLPLVARGLTNRAVADALHISERTVDTHVAHILDKLGLDNRTQLASWLTDHDGALPSDRRS